MLPFRPDRSHHVRGLGMMKAVMSGPSRPSLTLTLALPLPSMRPIDCMTGPIICGCRLLATGWSSFIVTAVLILVAIVVYVDGLLACNS